MILEKYLLKRKKKFIDFLLKIINCVEITWHQNTFWSYIVMFYFRGPEDKITKHIKSNDPLKQMNFNFILSFCFCFFFFSSFHSIMFVFFFSRIFHETQNLFIFMSMMGQYNLWLEFFVRKNNIMMTLKQ